jgi:hypothetical protein
MNRGGIFIYVLGVVAGGARTSREERYPFHPTSAILLQCSDRPIEMD